MFGSKERFRTFFFLFDFEGMLQTKFCEKPKPFVCTKSKWVENNTNDSDSFKWVYTFWKIAFSFLQTLYEFLFNKCFRPFTKSLNFSLTMILLLRKLTNHYTFGPYNNNNIWVTKATLLLNQSMFLSLEPFFLIHFFNPSSIP